MKKTNLLFPLTLALLVSALTVSCSTKKTAGNLSKIKAEGAVTIAMEGAWQPWTYHNENNELTGFDVEVGRKIAEKLGVEAKFAEVNWDAIFLGIDSGIYDMACNGVEVTPERSEKYNFSIPYAFASAVLIVKADNHDIHSFEDLKGKTTTNSLGSTYAEIGEKYGATVQTIDSFEETIQNVENGRVDATINDEETFNSYIAEKFNGDPSKAPVKAAAKINGISKIAIPVRKSDETSELLDAVNSAIKELKESGQLSELSVKYFGKDITSGQ